MKRQQPKASIGPISHGTMRSEDLIESFSDELARLIKRRRGYDKARETIRDGRKWLRGTEPEYGTDEYDTRAELGSEIVNELFDALQEHAPPYCYFGAHEGDGSDYGFWLIDFDEIKQGIENCDGILVGDLSEVPSAHRGEVLLVNDHGNATLYVKTARKMIEQWSVV